MESIGGYFEFFLMALSAIVVIINPLTVTFLFMSVTPFDDDEQKQHLALRATKIGTANLFAFALLGSLIFQFLGVTLGAFKIAGGIILFSMAIRMIGQSKSPSESYNVSESALPSAENLAVMPLAIPFISGPGSITTVMVLSTRASSYIHIAILFLAILVTTISCYYTMKNSRYITRLLGETGKEVIVRLFGLILTVLAVQFVIDGVAEAIHRDFGWLFRIIEENNGANGENGE